MCILYLIFCLFLSVNWGGCQSCNSLKTKWSLLSALNFCKTFISHVLFVCRFRSLALRCKSYFTKPDLVKWLTVFIHHAAFKSIKTKWNLCLKKLFSQTRCWILNKDHVSWYIFASVVKKERKLFVFLQLKLEPKWSVWFFWRKTMTGKLLTENIVGILPSELWTCRKPSSFLFIELFSVCFSTWLLEAATFANSAWETLALFISCWISS